MSGGLDDRKDIASRILNGVCGLTDAEIVRYPNGYCHSVYYVKSGVDEYVIRITGKDNEAYYTGGLRWLSALGGLGIPVPKVLRHGWHEDVYYTLISYIKGRDLGDVYNTLTDHEKRDIAQTLANIQGKVSALPEGSHYGYTADEKMYDTWAGFLQSIVNRSRHRIVQNGVWDASVCDALASKMSGRTAYFAAVKPTAFLGDVTTKNVLIDQGRLAGIVDVDEICYGDALSVVGLTQMALLSMNSDTDYIRHWLDAMSADAQERDAVTFYALLSCVDFMGEQGMRFDNGNAVTVDRQKIDLLNEVYYKLLNML